jgi:hypothetical protein
MTIKSSQGSNPKIRCNFKIPDLILLPSPKFLPISVTCSNRRDCIHMHKTDFNLMTCQSNNVGFNPLFFWEEFVVAKRGKIATIQTFKTESFNRSFYLSIIVMFEVNSFAHTCNSLADCRRWL